MKVEVLATDDVIIFRIQLHFGLNTAIYWHAKRPHYHSQSTTVTMTLHLILALYHDARV
jgi:hypothetical protein